LESKIQEKHTDLDLHPHLIIMHNNGPSQYNRQFEKHRAVEKFLTAQGVETHCTHAPFDSIA